MGCGFKLTPVLELLRSLKVELQITDGSTPQSQLIDGNFSQILKQERTSPATEQVSAGGHYEDPKEDECRDRVTLGFMHSILHSLQCGPHLPLVRFPDF
jgi:hypothetical protein